MGRALQPDQTYMGVLKLVYATLPEKHGQFRGRGVDYRFFSGKVISRALIWQI